MNSLKKYLKYKNKYLNLKYQNAGSTESKTKELDDISVMSTNLLDTIYRNYMAGIPIPELSPITIELPNKLKIEKSMVDLKKNITMNFTNNHIVPSSINIGEIKYNIKNIISDLPDRKLFKYEKEIINTQDIDKYVVLNIMVSPYEFVIADLNKYKKFFVNYK
jgi:hypothetical protein